jgi:hypothetical protein
MASIRQLVPPVTVFHLKAVEPKNRRFSQALPEKENMIFKAAIHFDSGSDFEQFSAKEYVYRFQGCQNLLGPQGPSSHCPCRSGICATSLPPEPAGQSSLLKGSLLS